MRALLLLVALVCANIASAHAQPWADADSNRYWHLKEERIDAYRRRDRAFFEALLADDFVTLSPNGELMGREAYLDAEFGPQSAEAPSVDTDVSDFHAARSGATLVLSYVEREHVDVSGQAFDVRLARLDVYARQGGRWRLATMSAVRLPEAPAVIAMAPEELAAYVGVYEFGPGVTSTVTLAEGRLLEQSTGSAASELLPVGRDAFYAPPDLTARTLFERDAQGRVAAQIYQSGGQSLRAVRVADAVNPEER